MHMYQVDIDVADDPAEGEKDFLTEKEIKTRFPWAKPFLERDPELFSIDLTTGLTRIRIKNTGWTQE